MPSVIASPEADTMTSQLSVWFAASTATGAGSEEKFQTINWILAGQDDAKAESVTSTISVC